MKKAAFSGAASGESTITKVRCLRHQLFFKGPLGLSYLLLNFPGNFFVLPFNGHTGVIYPLPYGFFYFTFCFMQLPLKSVFRTIFH